MLQWAKEERQGHATAVRFACVHGGGADDAIRQGGAEAGEQLRLVDGGQLRNAQQHDAARAVGRHPQVVIRHVQQVSKDSDVSGFESCKRSPNA